MDQKEKTLNPLLWIGEVTPNLVSLKSPYFFILIHMQHFRNLLHVFKPSAHLTLPAEVCPNVPLELSLNKTGVWGVL